MFVISTNSVNAKSVTTYQNMLATDAFANFYTIMHDVSLSPGMGAYLNMLNSAKPTGTQIANENYGRELMQLFSLGLEMQFEIRSLTSKDAAAFQVLRLRSLRESPEAFGSSYDEEVSRPLTGVAARDMFDQLATSAYGRAHPLVRVKYESAEVLPYYYLFRERAVLMARRAAEGTRPSPTPCAVPAGRRS